MSNPFEDPTVPRFITAQDIELALETAEERPAQTKPHGFAVSCLRRFGIPGMHGFSETFEVEAVFVDPEEAQSYVDGHAMPDHCTISLVPIVGIE